MALPLQHKSKAPNVPPFFAVGISGFAILMKLMGRLVVQPDRYAGEIPPEKSILMLLLEQRISVHYSCRRGLCGQDLVRIVKGWEHLNAIQDHEEGTLELLQATGKSMRMACCAKVIGNGEVIIEIV